MTMSDTLQNIYKGESIEAVGRFHGDADGAAAYFSDYLEFVSRTSPPVPDARLLDIGCGTGWSSFLFAKRGYRTTGMDLNGADFEAPSLPDLELREASVMEVPFPNDHFDVVSAYQTLEHVPDPKRGLSEMVRVCKRGGVICVVGPNLISLYQAVKAVRIAVSQRPIPVVRTAGMARHPYGNTLPEAIASIPLTAGRLLVKGIRGRADFWMREPDLKPPFHADNDACYYCNPFDLVRFFAANGCSLLQNGAYGRAPWKSVLAGGTWVAARKN